MGPPLQTARLQLREWRIEDADAAYAMYGDAEVVRFIRKGLPVADLAAQRLWLADRIDHYRSPTFDGFGAWAMVERDSQQVIGTMLLRPLPSTDDEIEIGWHLARKAWGHGYATEAGTAVLRYGFSDLGLGRICALVNPQNIRSAAVARRIGLQWMETTSRYHDGDDVDLFALDRRASAEAR